MKNEKNLDEKSFRIINNINFKNKNNFLYIDIQEEIIKVQKFLDNAFDNFPKTLGNGFLFEDAEIYLESNSVPNNSVCCKYIDNFAYFKCEDCSKNKTSKYCTDCYFKSKSIHKNHKVYLCYGEGICNCGDHFFLNNFCSEHNGPFNDKTKITQCIDSVFDPNKIKNLELFFDYFFKKFSKFLILTEKCDNFSMEIFQENPKYEIEKEDLALLKQNFSIVFQNFLDFLYRITSKNIGMIHLVASYMMKNFCTEDNLEDIYMTTHTCINLDNNDIQIKYKNSAQEKVNRINRERHKCECPFIRLLISNWRDSIQPFKDNKQNIKFLMSFTQNSELKNVIGIIYLFLYNEISLNNNANIISLFNKFFIDDKLDLIVKKTKIFEEHYELLYHYLYKFKNKNNISNMMEIIRKGINFQNINNLIKVLFFDSRYFTSEIISLIDINYIIKKIIDCCCLIHNQMAVNLRKIDTTLKEKNLKDDLNIVEIYLLYLFSNIIFIFIQYGNNEMIKDIFNYFIDIILYNKNIDNLETKEYSIHLTLYRSFGIFLNVFCFNYSLKNNISIKDALQFVKNEFFRSEGEMQKTIDIILESYYRMLGFIIGTGNNYFYYYNKHVSFYYFYYFNSPKIYSKDYLLIKYLFILSERKISLEKILMTENFENSYIFFNKIFEFNEGINQNDNSIIQNAFNYTNFTIVQYNKNESNHSIYWVRFIQIIISIIKNDSILFEEILEFYNDFIPFNLKNQFFSSIKENKLIMTEYKNILQEQIILLFAQKKNKIGYDELRKIIYQEFINLIDENEFEDVLDSLCVFQIENKKKIFSLKELSFQYLDFNYYTSPYYSSNAFSFILTLKKEVFKIFNNYNFVSTKISLDFNLRAYENVLLNIENIYFFIKIIDVLIFFSNEKNENDLKNIGNLLLPIILNYLSLFASINSEPFIIFKLENENLMYKIGTTLTKLSNHISDNNFFNNNFIDYIKYVVMELNEYKIKDAKYHGDLNELNDEDYYYNNNNKTIKSYDSNYDEGETEAKEITESDNIASKVNSSKILSKFLYSINRRFSINDSSNNKIRITDTNDNSYIKGSKTIYEVANENMLCNSCNKEIKIKENNKTYAKIGKIVKDYFYINSFNSTARLELNKLKENNSEIKDIDMDNLINSKKCLKEANSIITTCGHIYHFSCLKRNKQKEVKCHKCKFVGNIIIPSLINCRSGNINSYKFYDIIKRNFDKKKTSKVKPVKGFDDCQKKIIKYLEAITDIKIEISKTLDYNIFFENIFTKFQSYLNYFINLFYNNQSAQYKENELYIIQNLILSIRYLVNINYFNINDIVDSIHKMIQEFIKGPDINQNIIESYENLYYNNIIDKLLFSFLILMDRNEITNTFEYIINWTLPYLSVWTYLRYLIAENKFCYLNDEGDNEKINISEFNQFLEDKNKELNHLLKLFFEKLYIIKILSINYDNYENCIKQCDGDINILTFEEFFYKLNLENLHSILKKNNSNNEINFIEIIDNLSNLLMKKEFYSDDDNIILDYNKIFNYSIYNIKNIKSKAGKVRSELLVQFIPLKFSLIYINKTIFDFFENYLNNKCIYCDNKEKNSYICLICGKKICCSGKCNMQKKHINECGGNKGIFLNLSNLEIILSDNSNEKDKKYYTLFSDNYDLGPSEDRISNQYFLKKESLEESYNDFISIDWK